MTKQAAIYLRVSSERQAGDDKVSVDQQLEDCRAFCEHNGFTIVSVFEDKERYRKTRPPFKGKIVEPSAKYDDRPGFLALMAAIETGKIDVIVCFDSSRLGRHLRVLGTLANSLDIAMQDRNGRGQVEIYEASKRTRITRIMLGILISMAQDENETRVLRVKMGKKGTLQQGIWAGVYKRFGYSTIKEPGKRGVQIVANPKEAQAVELIFNLADKGKSLVSIRDELIARGIPQKANSGQNRKRDWTPGIIRKMLRSPDYKGEATYTFEDRQTFTVEIPQIISPEQWARVQRKMTERIQASTRNTKTTWAACQHIAYCGECNNKLSVVTSKFWYLDKADGSRERKEYNPPQYSYRCAMGLQIKGEVPHSKLIHYGPSVDYAVWRKLADEVIKHPELIREQVMNRRAQLQAQGDNFDSEIARVERELREVGTGRDRLMSQLSRDIITEADFERVMIERNREKAYWQEELTRLKALRDDAAKTESDLEHAFRLLNNYEQRLKELDMPQKELKALPADKQIDILTERKQVIQSLCERVTVYSDGRILIDGMIDTSKELRDPLQLNGYAKLAFMLDISAWQD